MSDASSFMDALLAAKKLQATEVFSAWDMDGDGRIAIEHLRPLLLSVFPLSSSLAKGHAAPVADHLPTQQVKKAYEKVTGREWAPPPLSRSPAPASAMQSRSRLGPTHRGPTLNDVHAIIDVLCSGHMHAEAGSSLDSHASEEDATTWLFTASKGPSSTTELVTRTGDTAGASTAASKTVHCPSLTNDARVVFLYGSMEAIYRTFCRAAVSPGEPAPDMLPIDTVHLGRIAWNVHAQRLKIWEGRALHRLLAAKGTTVNAIGTATTPAEEASHLTLEAFVELLCAM
ncbi:hypothetical protein, unknown function [Leishmania tarentolae]|uniref:EF-hand domain-containing protein n=1 Tax=Leishmania tarentolae TaxID=5689 RepID=A0A640KGS3_LEITA|nr:hypothetical protein, unknown function [Leishmania tarentolae]